MIYDLPMMTDEDKKIYNRFHKNLHYIGFYMIQYSIYTKVIQNDMVYNQYKKKLKKIIPQKGNIAIFKITEKQFQNIIYLNGSQNRCELIVGGNELVIFSGGEND